MIYSFKIIAAVLQLKEKCMNACSVLKDRDFFFSFFFPIWFDIVLPKKSHSTGRETTFFCLVSNKFLAIADFYCVCRVNNLLVLINNFRC